MRDPLAFTEARLTATLNLDDGTAVCVPSGVHARGPASGGRIMAVIPVTEVPAARCITSAEVRNEAMGVTFGRVFSPALTVPPGGTVTVSFGPEDAQLD